MDDPPPPPPAAAATTRMKIDEFKGGVKVFNADGGTAPVPISRSVPKKRTSDPSASSTAKRKLQLSNTATRPSLDTKGKRERRKPPVPIMRSRSDVVAGGSSKEGPDSVQLRKSKSERVRIGGCEDPVSVELGKVKPEIGEEDGIEGELEDRGVVDEKVVVNESEFSGEEEEEEEEAEELGEEEEETESDEEEEGKKVSEIKEIVVFEPKRTDDQENSQINRVPKSSPEPVPSGDLNKEEPKQLRIRRNVANPLPPSKNLSSDYHSRRSEVYKNHAKPTSQERPIYADRHSKLQNLGDLIMWRDVSRSTLVFGMGTFTILSSSYTSDINISCISVVSYMGLVYLALIFLYRSLVCRGRLEEEEEGVYVIGEEEAMWVVGMVIPYLNEFLLKLKALFSGDPSTTMKLAVVLYALAKCGSSITIWNLAKFGFFGVFVVPKLCSSYSSHIAAYGTFWLRRFRDAWDSCTHKKAVAGAAFTLVWNLCSSVARIWAVFMLYVAFRYYQQHMMKGTEAEFTTAAYEEDVTIRERPVVTETSSKGKKSSTR